MIMNYYCKYFLAIILSVIITAPLFCSAQENIFYMSQGKEKEGIASIKNNADKIDILAPQFYAVSSKLILTGKLDARLKQVISQKKIKVMPLVVNAGFRQSVIHNLLLLRDGARYINKVTCQIWQKTINISAGNLILKI